MNEMLILVVFERHVMSRGTVTNRILVRHT